MISKKILKSFIGLAIIINFSFKKIEIPDNNVGVYLYLNPFFKIKGIINKEDIGYNQKILKSGTHIVPKFFSSTLKIHSLTKENVTIIDVYNPKKKSMVYLELNMMEN